MLDVAPARSPFTLVCLVLAFAPATVGAAGQASEAEDQIVLSGTVEVARGNEVGEVVVLHGSARIDGVAFGDVIVLDGGIIVEGQVSGSVIAMDGSVKLGSSAHVGGDVTARGRISVSEGAVVAGRIRQHAAFTWRTPVSLFGRFATWLAVTVSTLLLGLAIVFVAPRGMEAAFDAARSAPWFAAAWGSRWFWRSPWRRSRATRWPRTSSAGWCGRTPGGTWWRSWSGGGPFGSSGSSRS
jgi:hypothetical protein